MSATRDKENVDSHLGLGQRAASQKPAPVQPQPLPGSAQEAIALTPQAVAAMAVAMQGMQQQLAALQAEQAETRSYLRAFLTIEHRRRVAAATRLQHSCCVVGLV